MRTLNWFWGVVVGVVSAAFVIGVIAMGISVAGFFRNHLAMHTRILLIIGGILMIAPHVLSSLIGFVLILLCLYAIPPKRMAAA